MKKRIVAVVSVLGALTVLGLAVWLGLNMVGDMNKYSAARARENAVYVRPFAALTPSSEAR